MDSIEDDELTNLCWLNESNKNELESAVQCSSNSHIDDDLKCLCWIIKMRPTSCCSQSHKELSVSNKKVNHDGNYNYLIPSSCAFDYSLNTTTNTMINTRHVDNNPTSRLLTLRTINNQFFPTKPYQQSFILIRSTDGKMSYISIRHFV